MAKSKKLKEKEANARHARLMRDHQAGIDAREKWREEANKELRKLVEDKEKELANRSWYKKLLERFKI